MRSPDLSRRSFLAYTSAAAACTSAAAAFGTTVAAGTAAANPGHGTLLDYAAGVPSAAQIKAAGHVGVIRYVSDRRPGAEWMAGKPLLEAEVDDLRAHGLSIVSCYQYGKAATADWRGGMEAGKRHAERGLELHLAAGGPADRPIYASIDDNPTPVEFAAMIAPYLLGWHAVLGRENVGVYANAPTIELARVAGLGAWYWQHNWGTPKGVVHPAAHLHQFEIDKRAVDGIGVDLNSILKPEYGQW